MNRSTQPLYRVSKKKNLDGRLRTLLCADQTTAARLAVGLPRSESGLGITLNECLPVSLPELKRAINSDEVHIWYAKVSAPEAEKLAARNFLSEDELTRTRRFHFEKDRQNFIFCRSMLRILLASYLGSSPAELRFAYSAHGKPSLATSSEGLEFNLSHSNGMFLAAIAFARRVGVDIECLNRELNVLEIAQRFFSPREKQAIASLPDSSRHEAFFSCWTRKEAFVKARGEGLSLSLDGFDVSVVPEDETISLVTRPDLSAASAWKLRSLNCFPGYKAAVAVEVSNNEVFGV